MHDTSKPRLVSESQTEQVQVVMPLHLNGYGNLFGGQLAVWIDILAGVVARKHCGGCVTTAAIDNLRFREPVTINEIVVLKGKMTYVGETSMEVRVDSYVDDCHGSLRLINTAFVILVAIDENGQPRKVPPLEPHTPEEKREYDAGEKRRSLRTRTKIDLYE